MKNSWFITLLHFWLLPWASAFASDPTVQNGVLDLRGRDLNEPISATGDWEFYWEKLLTPSTIEANGAYRAFVKVPGLWSNDDVKRPVKGYATYRIRVVLDQAQKITVSLPSALWCSSLIFIDGDQIAAFGKVGSSPEESQGGVGLKMYEFVPKNPTFDIMIQIANFEFFLNGMTASPAIGQRDVLTSMREQSIAIDLFIIGSLFIMGIYHVCLYLLRTEDPSTVWLHECGATFHCAGWGSDPN